MNAVVQPSQDAQTGAAPAQKATKPRASKSNTAAADQSATNVTPLPRPAAPERRQPRGINGFQIPATAFRVPITVSLRTHEVIKLADVGFAHAHESFFNIEYVLPHYQNENADRIKTTEASMNALVDSLAADMSNEVKRIRRVAKESGVELHESNFKSNSKTDVEVASKYAVKLLNILKDLDELNALTAALNFNSVISNSERVRLFSQWRNRLTRFMRSLKHHYYQLKQRGELPDEPDGQVDVTADRLQDELEQLDAAAAKHDQKGQAEA